MATASAVQAGPQRRDNVAAGAVIGSHTLQHLYGHAFWIVLPEIYVWLSLTPIAAGLVGTVRNVGSGVSSTVGGFLVDRLQHRRLAILYISLVSMGFGYFLVGSAPNYVIILAALMLASIAGSVWHPTARGLLSQIYPRRRGFMISIDRSAGGVGDSVGPLAAGLLIGAVLAPWVVFGQTLAPWRVIFLAAFPLAILFMVVLYALLRRSDAFQEAGARSRGESRPMGRQLRDVWGLFREHRQILSLLILIKAIAGFGQGGLFVWLPLYLTQSLEMSTVSAGFHLSLLTAVSIASGPAFGYLSDRIGRMPVILIVLAAKVVVAVLIALAGAGLTLTLLIAAMGAFNMVVNPLVQAWALDIAHGRNLEGSTLGVLDGANSIFRGGGPLMTGVVVTWWGYESLFWYIAAMGAAALLVVMLTLPFARTGRPAGL